MSEIRWKDEPEESDYEAAARYLSLIASPAISERLVGRLRDAEIVDHAAKDILRASSDANVSNHTADPTDHDFSPVLLVATTDLAAPLIILHGFGEVNAAFAADPDTPVPCKLIRLP